MVCCVISASGSREDPRVPAPAPPWLLQVAWVGLLSLWRERCRLHSQLRARLASGDGQSLDPCASSSLLCRVGLRSLRTSLRKFAARFPWSPGQQQPKPALHSRQLSRPPGFAPACPHSHSQVRDLAVNACAQLASVFSYVAPLSWWLGEPEAA